MRAVDFLLKRGILLKEKIVHNIRRFVAVFDSGKFIGGGKMLLYSEKASLSTSLITRIENLVKDFCTEKKVSSNEIPELLDVLAINRLAQNLGLKVKADSSTKELPKGLQYLLSDSSSPSIVI